MESLSEEIWDVVIAGTSIPQSLLALALSRSGKKVLHLDCNAYYGGDDAGLSLQDAEEWVENLQRSSSTVFHDALISRPADAGILPFPSRSYNLSLNPQIIYAKSEVLPILVSSQIHTQLEFLVVGSWWVLRHGHIQKIPSTREDVFNDESLSMRDKRGLMKFLRYVLQEEEELVTPLGDTVINMSLKVAMSTKFKIPESLQSPLLALALSPVSADSIPFEKALARIRRHLRSMGFFGQGFGAVIAKYGGNSEISQVACRAQAVGGGVYLLGHGLRDLEAPEQDSEDLALAHCTLSDGTRIRSRYVAGRLDDIPSSCNSSTVQPAPSKIWRSINVIGDPLRSLFPPTSDNGPIPAVAIVLVDTTSTDPDGNPVYLQIHSEDTGECPAGQCIIYASVVSDKDSAKDQLGAAVTAFLETLGADESPLWLLSYRVSGPTIDAASTYPPLQKHSSQILILPPPPHDIAFGDGVLDGVKEAWELIAGPEVVADSTFLRFEERESEMED